MHWLLELPTSYHPASHCFSVRPSIRWCLLEQQQIWDGDVPAENDDQLGHCLQCLVSASYDQRGRYPQNAGLHLALCDCEPGLSGLIYSFLQTDEDAVQFANRVKSAIARQGGLVDLLWWVRARFEHLNLGECEFLLELLNHWLCLQKPSPLPTVNTLI